MNCLARQIQNGNTPICLGQKALFAGIILSLLLHLSGCGEEPAEEPHVAKQAPATPTQPLAKTPTAIEAQEWEEVGIALVDRLSTAMPGDLDEIRKRGVLRVLVNYDKTRFFVVNGKPRGYEYELLHEYEKQLNKGISRRELKTKIVFVPTSFENLIPFLLDGKGDMISAGMTVTRDRRELVDFTQPYIRNVDEMVVANQHVELPHSIEDLSDRMFYVLRSSSYAEHLRELSKQLENAGEEPIRVVEGDSTLETEDILELVNAGIVDLTVADRRVAELWSGVLENIVLCEDVIIRSGGSIAWAVRKGSPEILESLNRFVIKTRQGTLLGNILFKRYYENTKWISNPLSGDKIERLGEIESFIRKYSEMYGFDWRLIAAMAYQESGLNHDRKSHAGAVGIMRVLPKTAAAEPITIDNVWELEDNIHAGVKILDNYRQRFVDISDMTPAAQIDFALAASITPVTIESRKCVRGRKKRVSIRTNGS